MSKLRELNELHKLKNNFQASKLELFHKYLDKIKLKEIEVTPMTPKQLALTAKKCGQVLYLPPSGFIYGDDTPRKQTYKISDIKFFAKTNGQKTQDLIDQIKMEGYTPFNIDMAVLLLKNYPNLIKFFNLTTSSYTDANIVSKETKAIHDDNKYWLSAYFGNFTSGKIKWRRDQDDFDVNFAIPAYKKIIDPKQ